MARTMDPRVDEAIANATLALLNERGFASMTMEAVANTAKVGKPTIYRRFSSKAALVVAVIARQLPELEAPDLGDTNTELWTAVENGFPEDGPAYVRLIGGLIAEQERHPELIETFRRNVLLPRRTIVYSLIERGQARGDVREDLDPEAAIDSLAGPFLARVFAGADTGEQWRKKAFEAWWETIRAKE
jgi:AcrR family transcriptional regulator